MDEPPVPRSPLITVGPVFVTLERLRTPNDAAVPRVICADVKVAKERTAKRKSIAAS